MKFSLFRDSQFVCRTLLKYWTSCTFLQVFEVIGAVYQYIKLLKQSEPQEWIFKELQDIGYMEFRFAEEQPPDDYAVNLAGLNLFFSYLFLFNLCSSAMFTELSFSLQKICFFILKSTLFVESIYMRIGIQN